MAHAKLSPSAYDRWSSCPGSVEAIERCGAVDRSSAYADEGTCAHWVLEQVLRQRYEGDLRLAATAGHYVGKEVNVANDDEEPRYVVVTASMAEHVQGVVDYVEDRRQALGEGTLVLAERRYSLAPVFGDNDSDGTADVTLVGSQCLEVVDLKFGAGVREEVRGKGQTKLYLTGAVCEFGNRFSAYHHTIAQPRNGGTNSEALTLDELRGFVNETAERRRAALTPGAPRIAGEKQCRWCPAKPTCKEAADFVGAVLPPNRPVYTAQPMFPDPDALPADALVRILDNAAFIRGFLTACEEHGHALLKSGNAPAVLAAAYKLVEGESRRRWANDSPETIAAALQRIRWMNPFTDKTEGLKKTDIWEQALRSPKKLEMVMKRLQKQGLVQDTHMEAFSRLIVKPSGNLAMVPVTDARPAAKPATAEQMFPLTTGA